MKKNWNYKFLKNKELFILIFINNLILKMRSKYKLPFLSKTLFNYICKSKNIKFTYFTNKRNIYLYECFLSFDFFVYNGFKYFTFPFLNKKTNKKLGEFVFTRKLFKFKRKKRK